MARHVVLRVLDTLELEPIDFFAREPVVGDDLDLRPFSGAFLDRAHIQHPVRIDHELDDELRDPGRHRGDPAQLEGPERTTVLDHLALALDDMELHVHLTIDLGREALDRAGRDTRVAHDELRDRAPGRLEPERQRDHIDEERALGLP